MHLDGMGVSIMSFLVDPQFCGKNLGSVHYSSDPPSISDGESSKSSNAKKGSWKGPGGSTEISMQASIYEK